MALALSRKTSTGNHVVPLVQAVGASPTTIRARCGRRNRRTDELAKTVTTVRPPALPAYRHHESALPSAEVLYARGNATLSG
jgi:hypothetical protein